MAVVFATAFVLIASLLAWASHAFGTESRPDFLDPRSKHGRWI